MNAPRDLGRQMTEKTDDQLLAMLKEPGDWLAEALDAAKAELKKRNVDFSTIIPNDHTIRYSDANILAVAKYQKAILWLILLSIPAYACAVKIPSMLLVLGIIALIFICQLASALKEPSPWLYVILGLIPGISFIALIIINQRATSVLKAYGIKVGVMGARKTDLDKLSQNVPPIIST